MPFPPDVKLLALVACGRCCCICHRFCGLKIELHHIVLEAQGGPSTVANCIPLCFDCHADQRSYDHKHPKGTKYSEDELRAHRDAWYKKVEQSPALFYSLDHLEVDRSVYREVVGLLPWDGSVNFVRSNNFAGFSFSLDRLNDFSDFEHKCEDPRFEFIDADLESLRGELASEIDKFSHVIGMGTFPVGTGSRNTVPPEWEIEDRERFERVVSALHGASKRICELYDNLMRMGKRKLAI